MESISKGGGLYKQKYRTTQIYKNNRHKSHLDSLRI